MLRNGAADGNNHDRGELKQSLPLRKALKGHSIMVSHLLFLLVQMTQLRCELVSCSEEQDDLNQSLEQWRNKVNGLEKTNCETRNLISILEDDIRTESRENKTLKTSLEKLASEKQQVRAKHLNTNIIRCLS